MTRVSPAISKDTRTGRKVTHKEFLGDLLSTGTAFATKRYELNPGLEATFPWIAPVANRYQFYRFTKLHFIYISRVGTDQRGAVMMAPEYDPTTGPPADKVSLGQYQDSVSGNVWRNMTLTCDAKSMNALGPRKFVRDGPVGSSLNMYDSGDVYIAVATPDAQIGEAMGELWVEYTIELFTPQVTKDSGVASDRAFICQLTPTPYATTVARDTTYHNVLFPDISFDGIGAEQNPVNGNITLPKGFYEIIFDVCSQETLVDTTVDSGVAAGFSDDVVVGFNPQLGVPAYNAMTNVGGAGSAYDMAQSVTGYFLSTGSNFLQAQVQAWGALGAAYILNAASLRIKSVGN